MNVFTRGLQLTATSPSLPRWNVDSETLSRCSAAVSPTTDSQLSVAVKRLLNQSSVLAFGVASIIRQTSTAIHSVKHRPKCKCSSPPFFSPPLALPCPPVLLAALAASPTACPSAAAPSSSALSAWTAGVVRCSHLPNRAGYGLTCTLAGPSGCDAGLKPACCTLGLVRHAHQNIRAFTTCILTFPRLGRAGSFVQRPVNETKLPNRK